MDDNKQFKQLLTNIELHLEEEISFINEICKENFVSFDNEIIGFYLILRELFREYKKEIKKIIKELENRKDKD